MFWQMKLGLAANCCHTYDFEPHDVERTLDCLSSIYGDMSEEDIDLFQTKMQKANMSSYLRIQHARCD